MIRRALQVCGSVQGVGFRWRAKYTAGVLGLTGWAENQPDGTVAMEVQGEWAAVEEFCARMEQGTPWAQVTQVEQKDIPLMDEYYFEIR